MKYHKSPLMGFTSALRMLFVLLGLGGNHIHTQTLYKNEYEITNEVCMTATHLTTYDGGSIILVGASDMNAIPSANLIKTDPDGNIMWTKHFSPIDPYEIDDIAQCADSGYFFCYRDETTDLSYHAVKVDQYGNLVFKSYLTIASLDYWNTSDIQVLPTNNGNYYVATDVRNHQTNQHFWHVFNLDSGGNLLWSNTYNIMTAKTNVSGLDTFSNGDLVVTGTYFDNAVVSHCPMMSRISPSGTLIWSRLYQSPNDDIYADAICVSPHGIFIAGRYGVFSQNMAILKIDQAGVLLWTMKYTIASSDLDPNDIAVTKQNNIAIAGTDNYSGFLVLVDSIGIPYSQREYASMQIFDLDTISASGFTLSASSPNTSANAMLFSTDSAGYSCLDVPYNIVKIGLAANTVSSLNTQPFPMTSSVYPLPEINPGFQINSLCSPSSSSTSESLLNLSLFPNPANDIIIINSPSEIQQYEILDVQGNIVRQKYCSTRIESVDVSDFATGVYFIRVIASEQYFTSKFVIAR